MTGNGGRQFIRMHDAWFTDPALSVLMRSGRHDAVSLFWCLCALSHMHDTDGQVSSALAVEARNWTQTSRSALALLANHGVLVRIRSDGARTSYVIRAYGKWQSTSDQRKQDAARMRTNRERSSNTDRQRERKNVRGNVPQGDDDSLAVVSLQKAAQERIAELERRDRGT